MSFYHTAMFVLFVVHVALDEGATGITFHEWLASITERINQTMHYQFDGQFSVTPDVNINKLVNEKTVYWVYIGSKYINAFLPFGVSIQHSTSD